MFFENGYQALAALDDDGDGYLTGKELEGLAVWRDKNGNGICDAGEVVPVGQLGIVGIGVEGSLVCSCCQVGSESIRRAAVPGATLAQVCSATRAGTVCGSCRPEIATLLTRNKVPMEPARRAMPIQK